MSEFLPGYKNYDAVKYNHNIIVLVVVHIVVLNMWLVFVDLFLSGGKHIA